MILLVYVHLELDEFFHDFDMLLETGGVEGAVAVQVAMVDCRARTQELMNNLQLILHRRYILGSLQIEIQNL